MRQLSVFILLLSLLATSCSTGKKALEKDDYYVATLQAVNRLRSNPDSKKALNALQNAYPMALKYYQDRVSNARHY